MYLPWKDPSGKVQFLVWSSRRVQWRTFQLTFTACTTSTTSHVLPCLGSLDSFPAFPLPMGASCKGDLEFKNSHLSLCGETISGKP